MVRAVEHYGQGLKGRECHKFNEHAEGKVLKWSSAEKRDTALWDKQDQQRS
ncbi:hypothetical protein K435DRAFT_777305, partial [Dendrothele bispora CBS 962.96]